MDVGLYVAAAGFGTSGPLLKSELTSELEMLQVNCRALLALTHTFGRRFVERSRGGVVLLSSMVAFQGVPFAGHYAATKAYVQSLAEALRVELAPLGVDVLAAAPGRRAAVLPGLLTKFLVGSLTTLPRRGKVRAMGIVMRGMTKHHYVSHAPRAVGIHFGTYQLTNESIDQPLLDLANTPDCRPIVSYI